MKASGSHVSMDAPLKDEEGNNLYDVMLDSDIPSPDDGLLNNSLQQEIERSLSTLGEREGEIIRYYFGLNGTRPHTLEEIGEVFGLTRERVRQIKEKSIKKLKNNYRNKLLKSYLGE
jgi:RNA polymerase primary sigma factor